MHESLQLELVGNKRAPSLASRRRYAPDATDKLDALRKALVTGDDAMRQDGSKLYWIESTLTMLRFRCPSMLIWRRTDGTSE
jgi:hypothetical protein